MGQSAIIQHCAQHAYDAPHEHKSCFFAVCTAHVDGDCGPVIISATSGPGCYMSYKWKLQPCLAGISRRPTLVVSWLNALKKNKQTNKVN